MDTENNCHGYVGSYPVCMSSAPRKIFEAISAAQIIAVQNMRRTIIAQWFDTGSNLSDLV